MYFNVIVPGNANRYYFSVEISAKSVVRLKPRGYISGLITRKRKFNNFTVNSM